MVFKKQSEEPKPEFNSAIAYLRRIDELMIEVRLGSGNREDTLEAWFYPCEQLYAELMPLMNNKQVEDIELLRSSARNVSRYPYFNSIAREKIFNFQTALYKFYHASGLGMIKKSITRGLTNMERRFEVDDAE